MLMRSSEEILPGTRKPFYGRSFPMLPRAGRRRTDEQAMIDRLKSLEDTPASKGKTNLVKNWKVERLTQRQAILAKCADCLCCHVDGRLDCKMPHCPLYPFMPYGER